MPANASAHIDRSTGTPNYANIVSDQSTSNQHLQKVPQLISSNQEEIMCSTCSSSSNSESANENDGTPCEESDDEAHERRLVNNNKKFNEKEIFIDFKPILTSDHDESNILSEKIAQNSTRHDESTQQSISPVQYRSSQQPTPEKSDYEKSFCSSKESKVLPKTNRDSSEEDRISFESNDEMQRELSENLWNVSQTTTVLLKQNSR